MNEQSKNIRRVWIAKSNDVFCGYITLKWQSNYQFFRENNIPAISDLNVLPEFRKNGIGTQLISLCERTIFSKKISIIGLGVGMTADYGAAQKLYVHLGFYPDGNGLHYKNRSLKYNDRITVDDNLVLYFKKTLS